MARTVLGTSLVLLLSSAASLSPLRAYTFIGNPPYFWPNGNVPIALKLGAAGRTLIDGNTSWDAVAGEALATWNRYLGPIQFAPATQGPGVGADGDRVSQVFFNSTVYGQFFGKVVLAVTTGWYVGATRTESDVTFNTAISWDSYRGPLRYRNGQLVCDLRRVALHEFGHSLGLDHPEQAGQIVSAIMNSITSDLDSLTSDDIQGAQALYPPRPPVITDQPQNQVGVAGGDATFFVGAVGTAPLAFQWYRNNSSIAGATATSYAIVGMQPSDAGQYRVRVSNAAGVVESALATLTVEYAPVITVQPQSQTLYLGANATFTVVADGMPAPMYQWKFDGVDIPGTASNTYTRLSIHPPDAGSYTVVVSNSAGSATSQPAILTVSTTPTLRLSPWSNGAGLLKLSGPPGKDLTIFVSPDLFNWLPIAILPNPHGTLQFNDSTDDGFKSRFYKVVAE